MQRLQTRPQFQAVLAGVIVAKTEHFALHRRILETAAPDKGVPTLDSEMKAQPKTNGNDAARLQPQHQLHSLFPSQDVWLGAVVPKRWARRAVTRNAIKRQIYTVSSGVQALHPHAAFVVRLRREFSRQQFVSAVSPSLKAAVRSEVSALLESGMESL